MDFFKEKVIWITGASSGIGEELVIQCAAKGAQVILSARSLDKLKKIQNKLLHPEKHLVLPIDLENSSNFKELAEAVFKYFGKIDILINNGGISQRAEASETPLEVDRRIMEINYFGNIALTKAILPYFQQQKNGHIVVTSSIAGKFGFYLRSAYAASKHALQGFYESLLLEEAKNNVHVTLVVPGKINTPISLHALNKEGKSHGEMDHNQATGMNVSDCASKILQAIQKNKKEVLIGKKEIKAVTIKRFFPALFWKIITKQSAT